MKVLLPALLLLITITAKPQLTAKSLTFNGNTIGFYEFKPSDYATNTTYNYPVIIALHGVLERGNGTTDLPVLLTQGIPMFLAAGATMQFTWEGQHHGFIVLAPQMSTIYENWQNFYIDAMIDYVTLNLRIDPNKIFLTGYSLGGGGAWKYVTASATNASKIAGIVPAAGSPDGTVFCNIAQNQVAVWAFHAVDDQSVPVHFTTDAVAAINSCSPSVPARATIFPDGNHNIWNTRVYDTTNNTHYPNIYQWMIKVSRSLNPATNLPPVPNVGPDVSLIVPVKNFSLDGSASSDPDDIIVDYLWEKISGPAAAISSVDRPITAIVRSSYGLGMDLGIYQFRLRVQDYLSQTRYDTINVEVKLPPSGNALPAADAGADITLQGNATSVTLNGQGRDWDGFITAYNWVQLSGPKPATIALAGTNGPTMSAMTAPGVYNFEFTVTDNLGGVGKDTIAITQLVALPVTITYFKGKNLGNKNILNWGTSAELNNDHFEIRRSSDGNHFTTTGTVYSRQTGGSVDYTYEDLNALKGISFYQLKQVDKDGTATLSKIISLNNTNRIFAIEKYPNPVHNLLNISIEGNIQGKVIVAISDMQGRLVSTTAWNKDQSLIQKQVNVTALQSGIYQLIISFADGKKEINSFVKY